MKTSLRTLLNTLKYSMVEFRNNYKHVKIHSKETNEILFSRLRMYCHMLDKGMNNVHFEKGHSLPIYNSALQIRDKLSSKYSNDPSFFWVNETLDRFRKAQIDGKPLLMSRTPIVYSQNEVEVITNFITNRTSCRNFIEKKIPSYIIEKIVRIAIDAPNGCCRQVVRYYITQNKEIIKQTIPHIAGATNFSNIQCLVCVAAEISYYDLIDKNLQFLDASLSVENFILGASLYGIYGTICNFFRASREDVDSCKSYFGVKETENIIMFIAMGYPVMVPQKPIRRVVSCFYHEV